MKSETPGNSIPKSGPSRSQANDIHSYRYGDVIVREGDENPCFYVILGGQVRISQQGKKIRQIEAQDIFGLENILLKKPSPYTVRAMDGARIASYGPDALDHFIRENPRMTQMILVSVLRQLTLTARNFSRETEIFPMDGIRVGFFNDGEVLIREGAAGNEFFRLVSTQRGLVVTAKGAEVRNIGNPGEFFGEISGLLGLPSPVTVTSAGESVVEIYTADDMDVIVKDYPETALHLMNLLVSHHSTSPSPTPGSPRTE